MTGEPAAASRLRALIEGTYESAHSAVAPGAFFRVHFGSWEPVRGTLNRAAMVSSGPERSDIVRGIQ